MKNEQKLKATLLKKLGITANQLLLAYFVYEKDLNSLIEYTTKTQPFSKGDVNKLIEKGLIVNTDTENEFLFASLHTTEKFEEEVLPSLEEDELEQVKEQVSAIKGSINEESEKFYKAFHELFPKGVQSGGKYVRSDLKSCIKKLKKFEKEYKQYDRETILAATKAYVDRYRLSGYKFMRAATYFIFKEGSSDLAAECENYMERRQAPAGSERKMYGTDIR